MCGARVVLACLTFSAGARGVVAQEVVGTLLVAHGADSAWNARIDEVARVAQPSGPVAVTFLMGPAAKRRPFQREVAGLVARGASRVVIVPMLVSSHSGHYEQIRWLVGLTDSLSAVMRHHLRESGIARPAAEVPLSLTPAMDSAPEIARVLADRATALLGEDPPERHALLLVGHGPNANDDHAAWMAALRSLAEQVRRAVGFRDARAGVVRDDAPPPVRAEAVREVRDLVELQAAASRTDVIVVPVAVSFGAFTDTRLRADLAGLSIRYDAQPLLPHEQVARWVEARVRHAAVR